MLMLAAQEQDNYVFSYAMEKIPKHCNDRLLAIAIGKCTNTSMIQQMYTKFNIDEGEALITAYTYENDVLINFLWEEPKYIGSNEFFNIFRNRKLEAVVLG